MKPLTKNAFKPSTDMIHAAESVFMCMAIVETIKPVVTGYQRAILKKHQFPIAKKWEERARPVEVILDPDHAYLLEDFDFQTYLEECRVEQAKAKLYTEQPEFCPLLVAEHMLTKAQWTFADAMEPITGIKTGVITGRLDEYRKYIDLSLRLLAPFVKNKMNEVNP